MSKKKSILIIEDNRDDARMLELIFKKKGYGVCAVRTGKAALREAKKRFFNAAILDIKLPDMDGMKLLSPLKKMHPDMAIIIITAYASVKSAAKAIKEGAEAYIIKPLKMERLLATVKEALEKQRLAIENRRLLQSFDAIVDMVSIHDKNYKIVKVNKAFANTFKKKPEEFIGKLCYEVIHGTKEPWPTCPHKQVLETEKPARAEFFEPHLGIHLEISSSPVFNEKGELTGAVHITKDISKRKKADEELRKAYNELRISQIELIQSEKLASIGQLAVGIAHEINNPLSVVSGEAEMLLMDEKKDKETKSSSKIISEQAARIKATVDRLLEFSRKKKLREVPLNLNDIVKKTISLLSFDTKLKKIEIIKELTPGIPKVLADSNQIQEVFLNIMLNAVQAMKEGGRLTIRSRTEKIIKHGRRKTDIFKKGQKVVVVEFEDTGKGMDEETLKRVFDPFFSTKEKGTGLGLSVCHGIIKNHKGVIEAKSRLGKGSTFIVKLPATGGGR